MPRYQISFDAASFNVTTTEEPGLAARFRITIGSTIVEGTGNMAITITASQFFTAAVSAVDARGNPATLDGPPTWAVSDPALLTLTTEADGSARVAAAGTLGNAQLTVEADADLGEGSRLLSGVLDVTIVAGEAVALSIAAGVPQEQ